MNAFLTGSQAYGTPREDSDVDLAIVMTSADLALLRPLVDSTHGSNGASLRFGRLNLIALPADEFVAWKIATERAIAEKPVTRERAIELIEAEKDKISSGDFGVAADLCEIWTHSAGGNASGSGSGLTTFEQKGRTSNGDDGKGKSAAL